MKETKLTHKFVQSPEYHARLEDLTKLYGFSDPFTFISDLQEIINATKLHWSCFLQPEVLDLYFYRANGPFSE